MNRKIFITFIVLIFFIFCIPIIINELYKINKGYLTLWNVSDVLSFYSVILSGLITIGALIVTIYYSHKDTEKQIRISQSQINVPFFIINNVYSRNNQEAFLQSPNGRTWQKEYFFTKYVNPPDKVVIGLTNIGDGIAIAPKYVVDQLPNTTDTINSFINQGDELELIYNLNQILHTKYGFKTFPSISESFSACITLSYQNTLGIVFSQEITILHIVECERNSVNLTVNFISSQNIEV